MNNAYNNYLMIMSDFPTVLSLWTFALSRQMGGGCWKSCVYVIKTFLMRIEFDCLVDRKGIGIEPVIVTLTNQRTHCTISCIFCSKNRSVL